MLFVWARALVFAHLNQLPFIVSGWNHVHVGPVLRREKHLRFYQGYFQTNFKTSFIRLLWLQRQYPKILEPEIKPLGDDLQRQRLYVFQQIPHWRDYFSGIKDQRELIRSELYAMLLPHHREQVERLDDPVIGVHVRLGDFRPLQPQEKFAQVGHVRTPLQYFIDLIQGIREIYGRPLTATIFSDGRDDELTELLQLPQVQRAPVNSDIVDLLALARSRLLITSAGSTFGYWAAFLSDAPVFMHPDHIHEPLRPARINERYFEGGAVGPSRDWPDLLIRNIQAIDELGYIRPSEG
jgi:hypothetical protein